MIYTLDFVRQRFDHFNKIIFKGKLPVPKFCLTNVKTYMGQMCRTYDNGRNGKTPIYTMKLNTRYDINERNAEDIIIHEMIHLRLWTVAPDIRDTSSHGIMFKTLMYKINCDFGRNITISTHYGREDTNSKQPIYNIVAVCEMANGETAITIPPRTRIHQFNHILRQYDKIKSVYWYYTDDPFFAKYPHPRNIKIYYVDKEKLAQHLKNEDKIKQL